MNFIEYLNLGCVEVRATSNRGANKYKIVIDGGKLCGIVRKAMYEFVSSKAYIEKGSCCAYIGLPRFLSVCRDIDYVIDNNIDELSDVYVMGYKVILTNSMNDCHIGQKPIVLPYIEIKPIITNRTENEKLKKQNQEYKNKIIKLSEIKTIQCTDGTWNHDPYMQGMANGLILAESIMCDTNPVFKDAPKRWLNETENLIRDMYEMIKNHEKDEQ